MSQMRERMLRGELYKVDDALRRELERAQELCARFNAGGDEAILRELLGHVGDNVVIRRPFSCDYGTQISIGAGTFVNFGCVMLDGAPIQIGEASQIASGVQLVTATHPTEPEPRRDGWEFAQPITLGDNVWLGAGVIVCPGVTIGDDTVVGAGAVVTRDLPAGVVAAGVPARVTRTVE